MSAVLLALAIWFPDVAHRPMPPPEKLILALIIADTVAIIAVGGAGVQSARASTPVAVVSTIVMMFVVVLYALPYIWVNTYGE